MKTNSTFTKITFVLTLGLMLVVSSIFAQTKFEVTTPGSVAGIYDMAGAGFGGPLPGCILQTPIAGELVIVDDGTDPNSDGCEAIQNDLTGKIALIDRGACEFGVKCLNAENAGAIMVVVCNNQATDIFSMGGGAVGDQVTIPALMISLDDCTTIRAEVPGATINVYWDPVVPSNDVVLWDGGQFDGGLGDWTTVGVSPDTAVWTWTGDGMSDNGNIVYSPSVCNGAALFDANVYNAAASGGSPPYPQFSGELISPLIDCSTFDLVSLKFYAHNLRLNGNTTFQTSIDNGATWGEATTITTENVFTATETTLVGTEVKRYLTSEIANQDSVRIKFTFNGDFYFFILDDVQLIEPERNNLTVMDNFYAIPPNMMTPTSQVNDPFSFLADVANIGALEQPNTVLNVSIIDETTLAEVFNEDLSYGTTAADSLYENEPFTTYFTPDGSITTYRGTYEISSDSVDFNPTDNFQFFNFETTDSTFAKESGATSAITPAAASWEGEGEPHSWAFGNAFYIVDGDNWHASSATFGIGAPADDIIGRLITIYLYRWDSDDNEDGNMDPDERTPVGFHVYEITGDEVQDDLINVPLLNFPSGAPGPIDIDSEQMYAVMIEYEPNDEVNFFIAGADVNYNATVFRSELDGVPEGNGRYGYLLGVNGDLSTEPYVNAGFNGATAPVARLNIAMIEDVEVVLDAANIIEVSPNPADTKINLNIDLVEMTDNVNIRILDISGRLIMDQNYEDVKTEMLEFDVSNFTSGAYFLHFITENGVRTERFIVQH